MDKTLPSPDKKTILYSTRGNYPGNWSYHGSVSPGTGMLILDRTCYPASCLFHDEYPVFLGGEIYLFYWRMDPPRKREKQYDNKVVE